MYMVFTWWWLAEAETCSEKTCVIYTCKKLVANEAVVFYCPLGSFLSVLELCESLVSQLLSSMGCFKRHALYIDIVGPSHEDTYTFYNEVHGSF
jgi:hypothetical protein